MGFLSNAISSIGKVAATALDYISAPAAKPVTTFTKGISAGAAEVKAQRQTGLTISQGVKQIGTIVATGAIAAGAVLAAAPAAATGAAGAAIRSGLVSVATSAIPKSTGGKIIAGALAIPVAAAVISHPSTAVKTISGIANVETNLIKVGISPTKENVKELVTENPIIIGGATALLGAAAIKTILPSATSYLQSQKVEAQTKAIEEQTKVLIADNNLFSVVDKSASFTPATSETPMSPKSPTTAQTSTINKQITRKKAKKKQIMPSINQNVNVLVSNKSSSIGIKSTKRYINKEILAR